MRATCIGIAALHCVEASTTEPRKPTHRSLENGMTAKVNLLPGYPVTVNHAGFAGFARAVACELVGAERVVDMRAPLMGAEDFSYVLREVPGALVFLGARPEGAATGPLSSRPADSRLMASISPVSISFRMPSIDSSCP